MDLVIRNANVVSPETVELMVDIGITGEQITAVMPAGTLSAPVTIDGTGLYAFPGFADMHCHLRDPGYTHKEDLITGAASAASGGYTDICCMPNTKPVLDTALLIEDVIFRSRHAASHVHPIAAATKGMNGRKPTDYRKLHAAGAIAFSDDGLPIASMETMIEVMTRAQQTGVLIMVHEEDMTIRADGVAHAGERAKAAGLPGIPRESEDTMVSRDLFVQSRNGGRLHFCHVSTEGALDLIRSAKSRARGAVTCEAAPHYFALSDRDLDPSNTSTKMNPPLREESDRIAVIRALIDGTIDVIATDHAPHSDEEKDTDFTSAPFGIIGFETAFAAAITWLYHPGLISLPRLCQLMSTNPRMLLGLPGGRIEAGQPADIALCDTETQYVFGPDNIVSRAHNSPFLGRTLTGFVRTTILDGRVVYDRSSE